jgi:hypothetical protein
MMRCFEHLSIKRNRLNLVPFEQGRISHAVADIAIWYGIGQRSPFNFSAAECVCDNLRDGTQFQRLAATIEAGHTGVCRAE